MLKRFLGPQYVKAVSQLSYTSKVRPGTFQSLMKNVRVAISNKEPHCSTIIEKKKQTKEPLTMFDGWCTLL